MGISVAIFVYKVLSSSSENLENIVEMSNLCRVVSLLVYPVFFGERGGGRAYTQHSQMVRVGWEVFHLVPQMQPSHNIPEYTWTPYLSSTSIS